ncbi:MAG TPA: guanylate kinase [Solirubrobacteraceae bacterium]|nr:guanylate kinase [Solirubrobacteraceae bacterium]
MFVITGPSGVGKGTLIRGLRERLPQLELSVSATTRAPRPGERDGIDYHFLSGARFDELVGADQFVEHADYAGRRYGTLRSELEERVRRGVPVVLEIEVQGARQVRAAMPQAVQVFISPPSLEALRERLQGRGTDDREEVDRRLRVAEQELAAQPEFAHVVVNDDLARATGELYEIVTANLPGGDPRGGGAPGHSG